MTAGAEGPFAPRAAPILLGAALLGVVLGGLVAALVLTAAGEDRLNGAGTLISAIIALAVVMAAVQWLARAGSAVVAEQLTLRPLPEPSALGMLAAATALVAVVLAVWTQVVDVPAALPKPDRVTGESAIGRLFGDAEGPGVSLSFGVIAGIVGLGVIGPWTAEIVLRGVALPALSAWRGPLLAVPVVSVVGLASGVGTVVDGDLIFCVLVLQVVLCLLRSTTDSLLPSIALSSLITGAALGVGLNWSALGASVTAVACAAASLGLSALAVICLEAADRR